MPAALRRVESHVRAADGTLLFSRDWLPEHPSCRILLVHGYAEHSGRYEELAGDLARRGAAVHAYDHRGHGRSAGPRCHVERFEAYLEDLDLVLERTRTPDAEGPLFLVGHSMGGLIVLAYLASGQAPWIRGAAVSGPPLALDPGLSRTRIRMARVLRRVAPRLSLASGIDPAGLSRDPEVVKAYVDDPLVVRTMTASLGAALLDQIPRTAARASRIQVPLFMLHGEADPICPSQATRRFFAEVKSPGSRLQLYPELRHEIFNEPERMQVYADLWQWIEELAS